MYTTHNTVAANTQYQKDNGNKRERRYNNQYPNDAIVTVLIAMWHALMVGARRWKQRPRRDGRPGGPNYTKGRMYYKSETTKLYSFYRIKDIQSLKNR